MRRSLFLLGGIVLFAFGCQRTEPTSWDLQAALPVASGSIEWNDLVPDSLTQLDQIGIVHFILERSLIDFQLDTLVALDDTTIVSSFTPGFNGGPLSLPPGFQLIDNEENMVLGVSNAEIRNIRISEGTLEYRIRSFMDAELTVTYDLPGVALPEGGTLSLEANTEPASDENPWELFGERDLADVEIDLQGLSGSTVNRLATFSEVSISPASTANADIFGDDSVRVELTFRDVKIEYARGYFGQRSDETTSEVDISPFIETAGSIDPQSIILNMEITNSVGADASILIEEIKATNSTNEEFLIHSSIGQNINLTRALDLGGSVQPNSYFYDINQDNSNITSVLGMIPNELQVKTQFELNPAGDVSGGNDFIYTDEPFDATLFLDLPMSFSSEGLSLVDTLTLASFETEQTFSTDLTLQVTNGFPIAIRSLNLQFFSQEDGEATLIDNMFIAAGTYIGLDDITPVVSTHTQSLPQEVFTKLSEGGYVRVEVELETYDQQLIQLAGNEKIDLFIVANGALELSYE